MTKAVLLDFLRFERDLVGAGLEAWAVDPLHDVVLGEGAVGLPTLRGVIERWIASID